MLVIDSNQTIKMSKGDDIAIPLFLDRGTSIKPNRYPIYENLGCEIYFYIYHLRDYDNPILEKTFKDNGEIVTVKKGGSSSIKSGIKNINEDNDFIIRLYPEDTNDLSEGQYIYQIKAKIIDKDVEPTINEDGTKTYSYVINTVTNRLPIYIIEDDYNRRIW